MGDPKRAGGKSQTACWLALFTCLLAVFPFASFGDDRSIERLLYRCSNDLGRRDITLFANGTVRLREGPWDGQRLFLFELEPEELKSQLQLLESIRKDSLEQRPSFPLGVLEGPWVDRCEIRLELPGERIVRLKVSAHDVPPLWVSRAIHFAEALAARVRPLDEDQQLPLGYRPRPGDVLRDTRGLLYRVVALTGDLGGVELEAEEAPVRAFYTLEDLRESFVALEKRGNP